jgi:hypothetical protein
VSWWIARAFRTLTEEVPAPPEAVRDFYADLTNMTRVHPLVVAVRATARTETADGYTQRYRIRDRIPLGPFTIPTLYSARLWVPRSGDVISQARQFPGVRLDGAVTFQPGSVGTRVVERLCIRAPWPLAGVTVREAVKAHITMLAGIRRHFESRH